MEKLLESGKVKSIGVSNFNKRQIQSILDHCKIKPANLQVQLLHQGSAAFSGREPFREPRVKQRAKKIFCATNHSGRNLGLHPTGYPIGLNIIYRIESLLRTTGRQKKIVERKKFFCSWRATRKVLAIHRWLASHRLKTPVLHHQILFFVAPLSVF